MFVRVRRLSPWTRECMKWPLYKNDTSCVRRSKTREITDRLEKKVPLQRRPAICMRNSFGANSFITGYTRTTIHLQGSGQDCGRRTVIVSRRVCETRTKTVLSIRITRTGGLHERIKYFALFGRRSNETTMSGEPNCDQIRKSNTTCSVMVLFLTDFLGVIDTWTYPTVYVHR